MIRTVFFDAMGTLLGLRGTVAEIYLREARRFGCRLENGPAVQERLHNRFTAALQNAEPQVYPGCGPAERRQREKERWRRVVFEVFGETDFPKIEEYFEHIHTYFSTTEPWRLEPGIPAVLGVLRGRGCTLGVISNFDSRLEPLLGTLGIGGFFDAVIVSSIVGAEKPDPRIFEAALAAVSAEPAAAVHIGDNLEADYKGARRAGLQAILYDPGRNRRGEALVCIGDFAEIPRFLL